jgi:hypothetical protein
LFKYSIVGPDDSGISLFHFLYSLMQAVIPVSTSSEARRISGERNFDSDPLLSITNKAHKRLLRVFSLKISCK